RRRNSAPGRRLPPPDEAGACLRTRRVRRRPDPVRTERAAGRGGRLVNVSLWSCRDSKEAICAAAEMWLNVCLAGRRRGIRLEDGRTTGVERTGALLST